MSDESFESEVRTLYWYSFIYEALEQFIIKYYLTLVTSTASVEAIAYLTNIFEPAIAKAVANRIVFQGSFETDQSKRSFRKPYYDYVKKAWSEPLKKKIKTKKGIFESHNFNQRLLSKHQIVFDPPADPKQGSNWGVFLKQFVLALERPVISIDLTDPFYEDPEELTIELEKLIDINTRSFLGLQIFRAMIAYVTQKQNARFTALNRFKNQIKTDSEMEIKRIAEIRKDGDDKIREYHKNLNKYKRLKQFTMVEQISKDITQFKDQLEKKISRIKKSSRENVGLGKKRLKTFFQQVSKDKSVNLGIYPNRIVKCMHSFDSGPEFIERLITYITDYLPDRYIKALNPFFESLFYIFELDSFQKFRVIQSLKKGVDRHGIRLSLSDNDKEIAVIINNFHSIG